MFAQPARSEVRTLPRASSTVVDRWILTRIQALVRSAPIRFALWDGFEISPPSGPAVATIAFRRRAALLRWVWDPELYFGEDYMSGAVEIDGDLVALLEAVYRAFGPSSRPSWSRHHVNGAEAAKDNVHSHYDLGNDFYRLWLDRDMVYTCAYFPTADATLEAAQAAKMDRVCRKLTLQAGERVVEAGCGWGALALFMAKRYGVTVRAFNLSSEQIAYARARAADEGLTHRVEFVDDDYRNLSGQYDAFVSIGMLEHVGAGNYRELGALMSRSITPEGRGLVHSIGRDKPGQLNAWIDKRIFPGAHPPTLREMMDLFEPNDLSVLDVENIRLHYARTLEHWLERYEETVDKVSAMFDETFVRAWRLYLVGSIAAFTTGKLQLFQVLYARSGAKNVPWTRKHVYDGHP